MAKHILLFARTAAAKSLQSCPTLCDPTDSSPPGSPVPGILQARILEWVAISFSNAWKWKVKVKLFSHVWLLATSWTAAQQAPLSVGFSRQEYWSGVPLLSPISCLSNHNYLLASLCQLSLPFWFILYPATYFIFLKYKCNYITSLSINFNDCPTI